MIVALLLACAAEPARQTVALVVLDTVRADAIGPDTPVFSAFAGEGIRYERAWSAAPWTFPSHGSLFTGLPASESGGSSANLHCDGSRTMVAESFRAAGYATAGFSNNPWVSPETGLAAGFDAFIEVFRDGYGVDRAVSRYVDLHSTGLTDAGARRTVAAVDAWLDEEHGPAFVFVNLIEAHLPYDPPDGSRGRLRSGRAHPVVDRLLMDRLLPGAFAGTLTEADIADAHTLYREEVAYVDDALGDLLAVLSRHGRGDALVVVTSDHGEAFAEHRLGAIQLIDHQLSLADELLHVPLAVRWPGRIPGGRVVTEDVGLLDVAPLLRWALDGRGTPALLDPQPDRAFAASYVPPSNLLPLLARLAPAEAAALGNRTLRAVRRGPEKLIVASDSPAMLFDTILDPGETEDLAAQRPAAVLALSQLLPPDSSLGPLAPPPAATEDALRALGYLP